MRRSAGRFSGSRWQDNSCSPRFLWTRIPRVGMRASRSAPTRANVEPSRAFHTASPLEGRRVLPPPRSLYSACPFFLGDRKLLLSATPPCRSPLSLFCIDQTEESFPFVCPVRPNSCTCLSPPRNWHFRTNRRWGEKRRRTRQSGAKLFGRQNSELSPRGDLLFFFGFSLMYGLPRSTGLRANRRLLE